MSAITWTPCVADFELRPLRAVAHRVVESQSVNSTRKLVDSDEEQGVLESLIDGAKPPLFDPRLASLHYLFFTPFRYPPLLRGSRFGTRHERGIWYGSLSLTTALAEVAYYRLVFLEGTSAALGTVHVELTAFQARVASKAGVDLTTPPFAERHNQLASKTSYAETQALGQSMRNFGVELFIFASARDPQAGKNLGLFQPAFTARAPSHEVRFACRATKARVEFTELAPLKPPSARSRHRYDRGDFEVQGDLPQPAV